MDTYVNSVVDRFRKKYDAHPIDREQESARRLRKGQSLAKKKWKDLKKLANLTENEKAAIYYQIHLGDKTEYQRSYRLWAKYGLTIEDYDAKVLEQGGKCKICDKPESPTWYGGRLSVDHNHKTGKVRGLLCNNCNNLLGRSLENPELLKKAALYLESYAIKNSHGLIGLGYLP